MTQNQSGGFIDYPAGTHVYVALADFFDSNHIIVANSVQCYCRVKPLHGTEPAFHFDFCPPIPELAGMHEVRARTENGSIRTMLSVGDDGRQGLAVGKVAGELVDRIRRETSDIGASE